MKKKKTWIAFTFFFLEYARILKIVLKYLFWKEWKAIKWKKLKIGPTPQKWKKKVNLVLNPTQTDILVTIFFFFWNLRYCDIALFCIRSFPSLTPSFLFRLRKRKQLVYPLWNYAFKEKTEDSPKLKQDNSVENKRTWNENRLVGRTSSPGNTCLRKMVTDVGSHVCIRSHGPPLSRLTSFLSFSFFFFHPYIVPSL